MFVVKTGSIERTSETELLDKVSFLIGSEEWNGEENKVVSDFFFVEENTVEESIQDAIVLHVREVIARDESEEVLFEDSFPWE